MNIQTEQEVVENIYKKWQQHFAPLNPKALASLYAEDAILFGSRVPPYIGTAAIESYFASLPPSLYTGVTFFPEYINRPISDVMNIAGSATFQRTDQIPLELRITHVLVRRESQWQIVSHHVSPKQNL
jgi:ketosteroid isomerase-like protein